MRKLFLIFVCVISLVSVSCSSGSSSKTDSDSVDQDAVSAIDDILQGDSISADEDNALKTDEHPADSDKAVIPDSAADNDTAAEDKDTLAEDNDSAADDADIAIEQESDNAINEDSDTVAAEDADIAITDDTDTAVAEDTDIAITDDSDATVAEDTDIAVTNDDDSYVPECNNGIKDEGETCDSTELACTDILGVNYSGIAPCSDNCSGYDTTGCTADTKTFYCADKPKAGTLWNTVASYTQTWDGSKWVPIEDNTTDYNTESSTSECRFKCAANYEWSGLKCAPVERVFDCPDKPASGTIWNSVPNFVQTWNGTNWSPPDDDTTEYNTESSISECRFKCSNNYTWNSTECVLAVDFRQWGTGGGDAGYSVAIDSSGNIFVTGYTLGGLDGNTNAGSSDMFVTKWTADLTKSWTKQLGSTGMDSGNGVAVDSSGNIFVTGSAYADFEGATYAGGYGDIFLVKYKTDGTKEWSKLWGTANDDYGQSVAVDGDGNIYVAGYTSGALDGGTKTGGFDVYLTKWNSDGSKAWTKLWGTVSDEICHGVAVDGDGNIFVTGYTYSGSFEGYTNAGGKDIFLTKLNSSGTIVWTKQWGTSSDDFGYSVAVDGDGNIFAAGWTTGELDGNTTSGGEDIYLTKWNADGTKAWTKQWGTDHDDRGQGVVTDGSGNIIVSGFAWSAMNDDAIYNGWEDVFLTKWSAGGTRVWTKEFGTYSYDYGRAVTIDSDGNFFMTGETHGVFTGSGTGDNYDVFLVEYKGK